MPSLRIVLDPESSGLDLPIREDASNLIHIANDDDAVISGLPDGMQGGKPSMMIGLTLPDGKVVIWETSWRLFAAAFWAFAAKFGDEGRPDSTGMALEYDATGAGDRVHIDFVDENEPSWFVCAICEERRDEPAGIEGATRIVQWVHRHFREKHPDSPVPKLPNA